MKLEIKLTSLYFRPVELERFVKSHCRKVSEDKGHRLTAFSKSFSMGNTDNNKCKKYRSKIRIRLTDPRIPDSYVCEIFDNSLEDEEGISTSEEPLIEKTSKPKNYFEVLMSKKIKKINVVNTVKDTTLGISDELFERSGKNQKNKKILTQSEHSKREKRKLETDSSEDESLLQIQRKCKSKSLSPGQEDDCILEFIKKTKTTKKPDNKNVFTVLKSSKVDLSQKKTFNILNYFSKAEVSLKKIKLNEEITTVVNSAKTSETSNNLQKIKNFKEGPQNKQKIFLTGINKENVKLAPVFCKKESTVIDAAQQKARLDFLYRSSSSVIKKLDFKVSDNFLNFPKVSHVQQRNDSLCWSQRDICLPLHEVCYSDECRPSTNKKFNFKIEQLPTAHNMMTNNVIKFNNELFHKAKCKYVELNLNLVIDGLKEKNEKFLAQIKEFEKLKISMNKQDFSDEISVEEPNTLWTEKYKPKSTEILGNENVYKKLKKWLQSWKSFDEELKALAKFSRNTKKKREANTDSDSDFLSSENEDFGLKAPTNVCIISGPNGCGKTALVYALANELEFGILELNSSSRRTGKKVLSDLQEATQSHKVHHVNSLSIGTPQEPRKAKSKKRRKKKTKEPAKILDQSSDCKISLILIEDADIVFEEHDEGFFSAITSLVQTSKRPLIFVSNEPDCHYLYSFKTEQCLILKMEPASFHKSCAVLDLVTQLEGAKFDTEFLESLVCHNNFDLRKSLLHLQFWMHSSQNHAVFQRHFDLGRLWWGLSKFLYKRRIRHFVIPKTRKRKRVSNLFDSSEDEVEMMTDKLNSDSDNLKKRSTLKTFSVPRASDPSIESYFRVLDAASVLDRFCLSGSSEPSPWLDYKPKDSLSLDENMEGVFWARKSLTEQLSVELISLSVDIFAKKINKNENEDRILYYLSPTWEDIRWRNSQEKASEELSAFASLQKGKYERSLHVDYLPILRNICRIERNRSEMHPKRKNRFYHYLNNLGIELNDELSEINCNVFYQ